MSAFDHEPEPGSEGAFTGGGDPWRAWNQMSPEVEFADFACALAAITRPRTICETGVGQGFITRRLAAGAPGALLVCYESDPARRAALRLEAFFDALATLHSEPTPVTFAPYDLTVLDSGSEYRADEIERWGRTAAPGAFVLIHDVNAQGSSTHRLIAETVAAHLSHVPGIDLGNPRGSFLGRMPPIAT